VPAGDGQACAYFVIHSPACAKKPTTDRRGQGRAAGPRRGGRVSCPRRRWLQHRSQVFDVCQGPEVIWERRGGVPNLSPVPLSAANCSTFCFKPHVYMSATIVLLCGAMIWPLGLEAKRPGVSLRESGAPVYYLSHSVPLCLFFRRTVRPPACEHCVYTPVTHVICGERESNGEASRWRKLKAAR